MGIPLPQQTETPPMRESCPHDSEIAELVSVVRDISSKLTRVEDALIGSLESPSSGALMRLGTIEKAAVDLSDKVNVIDERLDKIEVAAEEWRGLKRWGIGLVGAAVLGSGGIAKLVSVANQVPAADVSTAGKP